MDGLIGYVLAKNYAKKSAGNLKYATIEQVKALFGIIDDGIPEGSEFASDFDIEDMFDPTDGDADGSLLPGSDIYAGDDDIFKLF